MRVSGIIILFGWSVNSTNHPTRIEINTLVMISNSLQIRRNRSSFSLDYFNSRIVFLTPCLWPVPHENRNSFWQNGLMKSDNLKFNRVNKRFHIRFFYIFYFSDINKNSVLLLSMIEIIAWYYFFSMTFCASAIFKLNYYYCQPFVVLFIRKKSENDSGADLQKHGTWNTIKSRKRKRRRWKTACLSPHLFVQEGIIII